MIAPTRTPQSRSSLAPAAPASPSHTTKSPRCSIEGLYLTAFAGQHASAIASWIASPQELLWLAPRTVPPLTVEKVLDWGRERRRRHLLWTRDAVAPIGYAELNEMPSNARQMWIGHFILDPSRRGRGIGVIFAQALFSRAFQYFAATDVLLVVFPENHTAIECYTRAGMVAQGRERKYFETTGRDHVFLRMGIHRGRYDKLRSAGRMLSAPLPYQNVAQPPSAVEVLSPVS